LTITAPATPVRFDQVIKDALKTKCVCVSGNNPNERHSCFTVRCWMFLRSPIRQVNCSTCGVHTQIVGRTHISNAPTAVIPTTTVAVFDGLAYPFIHASTMGWCLSVAVTCVRHRAGHFRFGWYHFFCLAPNTLVGSLPCRALTPFPIA